MKKAKERPAEDIDVDVQDAVAAPQELAGELAIAQTVYCVACGKELARPVFDIANPWAAQPASRPCGCGVVHVANFYRRK